MITVQRKQRGFTLIEIMVVVVILGILAAILVPKIMNRPEQVRVVKAKQDILAIESALKLYKLDNGVYPTTDQGLKALVDKPSSDPIPQNWERGGYLKEMPIDPWNHTYQYINDNGDIKIFTYGPNGQGSDTNGEIGNWNLNSSNSNGN